MILKHGHRIMFPTTWEPKVIDRSIESLIFFFFDSFLFLAGIIQQCAVAHEQFVWDVRQNPNVHDVFAQLYNDTNLLSSFDGICLQVPPAISKKYSEPLGDKFQHVDQAPNSLGEFECVQVCHQRQKKRKY